MDGNNWFAINQRKMAVWYAETDNPNARYQTMTVLTSDQIATIHEMKSDGALLKHITQKIGCSLQAVYDSLNYSHREFLVEMHKGQAHLKGVIIV